MQGVVDWETTIIHIPKDKKNKKIQIDTKKIEVFYSNDFNILKIHERILEKLSYDNEITLPELKQKIENLLKKTPNNIIEKKIINRDVNELKKQLSHKEQQEETYHKQTEKLIKAYQKMGPKSTTVNWENEEEDEEKDNYLRHVVISRYLEIARDYIPLDIYWKISCISKCSGCGIDLKDLYTDESGYQICKCGIERYNPVRYSAGGMPAMISDKDDRINFYKALLEYQGKGPNKLPEDIIQQLDGYFKSNDLPTSEEIKKLALNPDGTRGPMNKELMYRALRATGNSAYYKDINLICNLYWGYPLPNVSHLEDKIMNNFDNTQKIYQELIKDRTSNLGVQYLLYQHLRLVGWQCYMDDFKIVKSDEIRKKYDQYWKIMVERCNLPFHPTI